MAKDVKVLREFRDNYLITNNIGRMFVSLYYEYSPPLADYISKHDNLRTATRFMLAPVVFAVKYPQVLLLGAIGIPAFVLVRRRNFKKS